MNNKNRALTPEEACKEAEAARIRFTEQPDELTRGNAAFEWAEKNKKKADIDEIEEE